MSDQEVQVLKSVIAKLQDDLKQTKCENEMLKQQMGKSECQTAELQVHVEMMAKQMQLLKSELSNMKAAH